MKKEFSNKKKLTDKKKVIFLLLGVAALLAVVAVVVFFATRPTNKSYENCAVGDVDGSGFIDSADSLLIQKYVSGKEDLFDFQKENADVNLDGKVDAVDAEVVLKYATGQINKLPYTGKVESEKPSNETSVSHKNEKAETSAQIENYWINEDGTMSYQLKVNIKNIDDSRLRDWKTEITLSADAEISKSWDCECEIEGKTITVTGENISAESEMNCGVIVKAPKGMKIVSVETEY